MPLPPLSTTSPLDWRYTAEGGANLVLSFAGAISSSYTGRALRLRKRKKRATRGEEGEAIPSEVGIEFGAAVVEPLLGGDQLPAMEIVPLELAWLDALVQRLKEEKARPPEREEEDEVDQEVKQAVVGEDLISGKGVLAVEIKPKWGFLPSPTHLSEMTLPIKRQYCRFCMHRYHKRASSVPPASGGTDLDAALVEHENGYCPLDLYSRDGRRVRRALDCLYDGWARLEGESNNFRVFLDGKKLSLQDISAKASLQAALSSFSNVPEASSSDPSSTPSPTSAARGLLNSTLLPILLASPLLATLSRLQATLDCLDIEGIAKILKDDEDTNVDITCPDVDLSPLGEQPTLEEWSSWLNDHFHLLPKPPPSGPGDPPSAPFGPEPRTALKSALCVEHPRAAVLAFLLSATFKDCSLIIRIPLPPSSSPTLAATSPLSMKPTVKAIDLDPKPISRLGKYWRMDREIVRGWAEMLEGLSKEERGKVRRCKE
ncbi:hypothetical protein JCM11251_000258 [Rhodosporidiobolus azoricus]